MDEVTVTDADREAAAEEAKRRDAAYERGWVHRLRVRKARTRPELQETKSMNTPPPTPTEGAEIVERLRRQSESASQGLRMLAEAKSLRQESNVEQRADLYFWPQPHETLEGKAATHIATQEAELTRLRQRVAELERDVGHIAGGSKLAIELFEQRVSDRKDRLTWWAVNILQDAMGANHSIASQLLDHQPNGDGAS